MAACNKGAGARRPARVVILKFAINQGKLFAPPGARVGGMGAFSAQACV